MDRKDLFPLNDDEPRPTTMKNEQNILVCGVNWIGDSVMSMPAIQMYRRNHPRARLTMLVKPPLRPLWSMHGAPDEILCMESGLAGTARTSMSVAQRSFRIAYVFPHSFRSALIPFLARVPRRVGMPGHARDFMLTDVVRRPEHMGKMHQSYEYKALMVPDENEPLEPPVLTVPHDALAAAREHLQDVSSPVVALIPGAARGMSKRWPAGHFARLGKKLLDEATAGVVLVGGPNEVALCRDIAERLDHHVVNLAGRLTVECWIALLSACRVVVANDSGGMHVAAAVGTPLVALYGMTDPERTGPLGVTCRILQKSDRRDRDISRHSVAARECLAAIQPEEVYEAVIPYLRQKS